ncbi:MAG: phosphatidylserine decarboxylase family protein [Thermodesulfobacteriota bacterium]|nr:phosphatidylserine decarboxylase family protein [Thermodesulfobacteriota bacterium]
MSNKLEDSRIHNKWPLAKEGLPFVFIACAITALFSFTGFFIISIFTGILSLFVIFFFRDPDRKNLTEHKAVLTPADGTILEIVHLNNNRNPLGKPAIKVSVFMSIFNVHVNRIPITGTIKKISYRPGKFFSANLDKASKYNESNEVILESTDSQRIVIIQIAGLIARRIACWIKDGDHVEAGQRFGLIRFGSRLEVYLPGNSRITARVRQKVRASETIIGYLP